MTISDDNKQISLEQAKACQTIFGEDAPACQLDPTKELARRTYAAYKALSSSAPTATKVAPAGEKSLFDGIDAAGQRNRQPAPVLFADDTLTGHLKNLGGR